MLPPVLVRVSPGLLSKKASPADVGAEQGCRHAPAGVARVYGGRGRH